MPSGGARADRAIANETACPRVQGSGPALAVLILLSALLVSPPVAYRVALGGGGRTVDFALLWSMALSLVWVGTLHSFFGRPALLHLLLLPLYFTVAADLFLVAEFQSRLTTSYLSLVIGDYAEAGEFLRAYAPPVTVGLFLLAATCGIGIFAIRDVRVSWPPWSRWAGVTLLVVGYGAAVGRQAIVHRMPVSRAVLDVASHDYSSPIGVLSQLGVAFALRAETERLIEARREFRFDASKTDEGASEVYVLAIGESSRPDRWSLNGYGRETTPLLAREPALLSFSDVVTASPMTAFAVPALLSLAPVSDWSAVQSQKSVIAAFRETGFQTYWLSGQEVSHWGGIIPAIAEEAHVRRYFDRSLDGVLVDEVRRILDAPDRPRRIFIVLHMRGSHFEFSSRYPEAYRVYPEKVASRTEYLSNTYDNSILYTDRVLSDLIQDLRARHVRAALMFVSDHGENLLDDERNLFGHAIGNEYDLPTAAFVWFSEELASVAPEKFIAAARARGAPLSASNFPHSLLDLAGIEARGLDRTKSVFSRQLLPGAREYLLGGNVAVWRRTAPGSTRAR